MKLPRCPAYLVILCIAIHTAQPAQATVRQQLDQLIHAAKGKRIGMITNPSGCDERGRPDVEYLMASLETTITAFFAPEHGLRGDMPAGVGGSDYIDPQTSVPVYAVYGLRTAPTDEQLATVDLVVFDMQDAGVRFYTRTWIMTHCMEACARNNKPFYVIDRPNVIGGLRVEGAVNTTDYRLIGRLASGASFGVATRHGMTIGEISSMWNGEYMRTKVQLHVIKMADWKREQYWRDTRRVFVPPSPNIRTPEAALAYPGTCVFEGSNLSEGRGTAAPFQIVGAPFINAQTYADALTSKSLPGVRFVQLTFTPNASKWKGETCRGVKLTIIDRDSFKPVRAGLIMLQTAKQLYPEQTTITETASRLMAIPRLHERLQNSDVDRLLQEDAQARSQFMTVRRKYLLY